MTFSYYISTIIRFSSSKWADGEKRKKIYIIYYLDDEDTNAGYMYLKRRKNNGYSFEERKLSQNVDDKLEEILEYEQGWNMIKDEYLKIKNRNRDPHKKSFILYLESIHNVYNHINQYKEKERMRRAFIPLNSWYGFIR